MGNSRLLFIIGTGRCGSTMTHEVLARHPDVGFISNLDANLPSLDLKGRWNNRLLRLTPQALTQRDNRSRAFLKLRARFGPAEAYKLLSRQVSSLISDSVRDLASEDVTPPLRTHTRAFYERRMNAQRKAVFLAKFSGWPRAGFFHEIFNDARFVHVVRDGRAVAESMIRRAWWTGYRGPEAWQYGSLPDEYEQAWVAAGRSYVVLAGLQWMLMMDAFDVARRDIPGDQWLEIRFEDLVADPRTGFGEILAFAGLQWNDVFDKQFSKYRFLSERRGEFHDGLTSPQVAHLNEIMGGHLLARGYRGEAR